MRLNRRYGATMTASLAIACLPLAGCAGGQRASTHMPAAEKTSSYLDQMSRDVAAVLGVENPPPVAVVRWVLPEEVQALVSQCLTEQGFTVHPDGSREAPMDQQQALRLADYECTMQYPAKPVYAGPLVGSQIEIQYEWTVRALIPCLASFGVEILDVPSRAKFVADWSSNPFRPYSQLVDGVTPETYADIEKSCPQNAPSRVVSGEVRLEDWLKEHPVPSSGAVDE